MSASTERMPKLNQRFRRLASATAASSEPAACWTSSCHPGLTASAATSSCCGARPTTIDTVPACSEDRPPVARSEVVVVSVRQANTLRPPEVAGRARSSRTSKKVLETSAALSPIEAPSANPRVRSPAPLSSTTAIRYRSAWSSPKCRSAMAGSITPVMYSRSSSMTRNVAPELRAMSTSADRSSNRRMRVMPGSAIASNTGTTSAGTSRMSGDVVSETTLRSVGLLSATVRVTWSSNCRRTGSRLAGHSRGSQVERSASYREIVGSASPRRTRKMAPTRSGNCATALQEASRGSMLEASETATGALLNWKARKARLSSRSKSSVNARARCSSERLSSSRSASLTCPSQWYWSAARAATSSTRPAGSTTPMGNRRLRMNPSLARSRRGPGFRKPLTPMVLRS